MSEARLEDLARRIREDPGDAASWGELARALPRLPRDGDLDLGEDATAALGALLATRADDHGLGRLYLRLHGLEAVDDEDREPPEYWRPPGRARRSDGTWWDAATGLPLRARHPRLEAELHLVPAGPFVRGGPSEFAVPPRRITLGSFYMARLPVRVREYGRFLEATGAEPPEQWEKQVVHPDHPVFYLGLDEVDAYCAWVGARLPSEAEWEKAARGTGGRMVPWGSDDPVIYLEDRSELETPGRANVIPPGEEPAVLIGNYDWEKFLDDAGTRPAGASPYGIEDLLGGLCEVCLDAYDPYAYGVSPDTDPLCTGTREWRNGQELRDTPRRVERGVSWISSTLEPLFERRHVGPDWKAAVSGVRLVHGLDIAHRTFDPRGLEADPDAGRFAEEGWLAGRVLASVEELGLVWSFGLGDGRTLMVPSIFLDLRERADQGGGEVSWRDPGFEAALRRALPLTCRDVVFEGDEIRLETEEGAALLCRPPMEEGEDLPDDLLQVVDLEGRVVPCC